MGLSGKKCLFLVQGEGRGHMTQSVSMKQILENAGAEVCGVMVGKSNRRTIPSFYVEKFGNIISTVESPNMAVDKKNRSVKEVRTFLKNLFLLPVFLKSIFLIHRRVKELKPDIIINFYEPLGGFYYLLFRPKVPMVCIAHHYMYLNREFEMPEKNWLKNLSLRFYTRLTSIGAKKRLALSFYPFRDDARNSIYVVPPLLREEVTGHTVGNGNYLLVYLLNSGYIDDIIAWHNKNPDVILHCFTDNNNIKEPQFNYENLCFHAINDKIFIDMMANAKGVVTTAGFESVCEAINMDKPVLMVPVKGHYEQFCNSRDAAKTGRCIYDESFNITRFLKFIDSQETNSTASFKEWVNQSHLMVIKHIYSILYENNNVRSIYTTIPGQYKRVQPV